MDISYRRKYNNMSQHILSIPLFDINYLKTRSVSTHALARSLARAHTHTCTKKEKRRKRKNTAA